MPVYDLTQEAYAQKMIDEYKAGGVPPQNVFAQSFDQKDILYWMKKEPAIPSYVQGARITNDAGGTTIAKAFTTSNVSGLDTREVALRLSNVALSSRKRTIVHPSSASVGHLARQPEKQFVGVRGCRRRVTVDTGSNNRNSSLIAYSSSDQPHA